MNTLYVVMEGEYMEGGDIKCVFAMEREAVEYAKQRRHELIGCDWVGVYGLTAGETPSFITHYEGTRRV